MNGDDHSPNRTSPNQYGWAGGCYGIVLGAVSWPIALILFSDDRDLILFWTLPFGAIIGGFLGGFIGGVLGLLARFWVTSKRK